MRARYILHAGRIRCGDEVSEFWLGVEIASERPIDLAAISRATGFTLIPADRLSEMELASVGVFNFEQITLGRYGNTSAP